MSESCAASGGRCLPPACSRPPDRAGKTLYYFMHLTNNCNLSCKYCYSVRNGVRMSRATGEKAVDLAFSLGFKKTVLVFFGGEPLLEWGLLRHLTDYAERPGRETGFLISTNSLLLDRKKLEFISGKGIGLQISADGPPEVQDSARVRRGNRGSSAVVSRVLPLLREFGPRLRLHFRLTLTPENAGRMTECLEYFIGNGFGDRIIFIDIEAIYSKWGPDDLRAFHSDLERLESLIARRSAAGKGTDVRFYADYSIFRLRGVAARKRDCCCGGRDRLAVTPEGDVFPCYMFACDPARYASVRLGRVSGNGDLVSDSACALRSACDGARCPFTPLQSAGVKRVLAGRRSGKVEWGLLKCDVGDNCNSCPRYGGLFK